MKEIEPTRPPGLDPLAVEILERLRAYPEANDVVLGGHLALKHYLDYRTTHDIEARWAQESSSDSQRSALRRLRDIVETVAAERGLTFFERATRSMTSLEMQHDAKTVFSVQIANRDIDLAKPVAGLGIPFAFESLRDNIASKITALVNRGAPRDFTAACGDRLMLGRRTASSSMPCASGRAKIPILAVGCLRTWLTRSLKTPESSRSFETSSSWAVRLEPTHITATSARRPRRTPSAIRSCRSRLYGHLAAHDRRPRRYRTNGDDHGRFIWEVTRRYSAFHAGRDGLDGIYAHDPSVGATIQKARRARISAEFVGRCAFSKALRSASMRSAF